MNTSHFKVFTPKKPKPTEIKGSVITQTHSLRERLHLPPRGKPLLDAIQKGFSINMAKSFASELSVDMQQLAEFIDVKPATMNRRIKDGVLTAAESDRLYRFAEVYDAALDLFDGNKLMVDKWLSSPARGLGGEIPITLLKTSTGANEVLLLLQKIDRGVLV